MFLPHTHCWMLLDCDSFFASCEILRNPSLRGKPVCVGKDIVLASSYEAKRLGVSTGYPVREAKKILPKNTVYLDGDMKRYAHISKKVWSWVREHYLSFAQVSIDEGFIDATLLRENGEDMMQHALDLQQSVLREIGIPVSIGVGPSKTLAKLFAGMKKPLGSCVGVNERVIDTLLKEVPVGKVGYIGKKTEEKLAPFCSTAYEFKSMRLDDVKCLLNWPGVKIWYELNSISMGSAYKTEKNQKSIARVRSFNPHFTNDQKVLRDHLQQNLSRARRTLREESCKAGSITVVVRGKDFVRHKGKKKPAFPLDSYAEISRLVKKMFEDIYEPGVLYRTTGVSFGELDYCSSKQLNLFDTTGEKERDDTLDEVFFILNKKYGRDTIRRGTYSYKKGERRYDREMSNELGDGKKSS